MSAAKAISKFKHDLSASIVVFFVALPLCLGIALASGAPLFAGIIAGIVGGVVVGAISGSQVGVSGPAAGLAVIVFSSISSLGSFSAFLLAVVIAGIIQIVMGLLRLGIIAYYFPSSVIKGMLSGIGVIIILKQIPHALGYDNDYEGSLSFLQADGNNSISTIHHLFTLFSPGAVLMSFVALSILLLWELFLGKKHKFFTVIQGPLVAVAVGIMLQYYLTFYSWPYALSTEHLVSVPISKDFSSFINLFSFPDFSQLFNINVYIVALTIAVVASLETLLCVEATDKLDPQKRITPTNRELVAQGSGNIISGLLGGLPITQVIVRSSANVQSGGKTKLSAILHGFLLFLSVILIPGILNFIPLSVLACILIVVGFKLAKPSLFIQMYRHGWDQFVPFIVTVACIVLTDLLTGILFGLIVGIFIILRYSYKNSHFLHVEDNQSHTNIKMTLAEEVSFLNKGAILNELSKVPHGATVIIDASKSFWIDHDILEIIENFKSCIINLLQ